ncbi:MAG: ABC transporter permease [Kofleriaceae bacterium]
MSPSLAVRLLTIEAVRALGRNKARSALAVLGIAFAVTVVIAVVALGRAGVEHSEAELDQLGDSLVWVEAGTRNSAGVRTGSHGDTSLTVEDAELIRQEIPLIKDVSENVDGGFQVVYGDRNWRTRWRGVAPSYQTIKRWSLTRGVFFDDDQTRNVENVVVIGETVRKELFGDDDPIGESVRIERFSFVVIGLLEPKGQSASGQDQDDTVMMPWTTARKRIVGKEQTWLDDILCSAVSPDAIPSATAQIAALLRQTHHIQPDADDDFNIRHPEELLEARIKSSRTLERLLLAIASISLIVGGIGVMNVMLASVSQRISEIGLRSAVGARPSAIQVQFLGEAVMLTSLGGAVGLLLGHLTVHLFETRLGWPLAMSPAIAAWSMVSAMAVGLVFGLYPAIRASRIDPIVALRAD